MKAFSRANFNVSKMLRVVFIGEGGVDDGGPRREFFSILMKETFSQSGLFSASPSNVVPVHSIQGIAENRFYIIGKMVSTSIVQGGQPPLCFAKAVADYILFDDVKSSPCLDDFHIRQSLEKVNRCIVLRSTIVMCSFAYIHTYIHTYRISLIRTCAFY